MSAGVSSEATPRRGVLAGLPSASSLTVLLPATALILGAGLLARPGYSLQSLLVECLLAGIFAYAWNLVGGFLGEICLAHAVYWGAGAYCLVLGANAGWSFWTCVAVAGALGAALGVATVLFAMLARLTSFYWMIATLLLVAVAVAVANESDALGRAEGVIVLGQLPLSSDDFVPVLSVVFAVCFLTNGLLARSHRGKRWIAFRDEPVAARVVGVRPARERIVAYGLSGALTGIGGCLAGAVIGFASPSVSLSLAPVVLAVLAVYVGGPGTVLGPLFGVLLLEGLNELFSELLAVDSPHAAHVVQYAVALVIVRLAFLRSSSRPSAADQSRASQPDAEVEAPRELGPVVLEATGIRKGFGGLQVLEDVSFSVRAGEIVGLVGPNGAGKTTLLNIVNGLLPADAGELKVVGRTADRGAADLASRGVVRTFQTPKVFESLTLRDSIEIAPTVTAADTSTALERFGLPGWLRARNAALTERKQVEQARVAAAGAQARVVLLDEPLSGLDGPEIEQILRSAREAARAGAAVLIVEHLVPAIAPECDRIVVLADGQVLADGPTAEVLADPRVIQAYLGSSAGPNEGALT